MILPARTLLIVAALWLGLAVAVVAFDWPTFVWAVVGAALAGTAAADAFTIVRRSRDVAVERDVARALPAGVWQRVHVRITSSTHALSGVIVDHYPEPGDVDMVRIPFAVPGGHWVRESYRLRMLERGAHQFGPVELFLDSPLGWWRRRVRLGTPLDVRVYPDFGRIAHYALLATDNRLSQAGLLRRRRRGEGREFHQLRDYHEDDSPRQIDWKASSRHRRLISREYQDERDQQIVLLLDCSHRMRAKDEDLSHFDHTLNAVLLLAYVALRQGDAVGLSTFGDAEPRFIAPRKSVATVTALLNAVYDLQPTLQPADYVRAAESLLGHLRRRALVVLATTARDEDDEPLRRAVSLLRRKHLVVVANLRESVVDELRRAPIRDLEGALTYAAASDYAHARHRQHVALRLGGARVLDVEPRQLPSSLVNQYWEMKRAGAI